MAEELSAVYPHGSSDSGRRREPGIKASAATLRRLLGAGTEFPAILEAAQRLSGQIRGSDEARYQPAMHRWLSRELWREVPAGSGKPGARGPEEAARIEAEARARDRARRVAALRAQGIEVGEEEVG